MQKAQHAAPLQGLTAANFKTPEKNEELMARLKSRPDETLP
jgi:hypothetical protein